MPFKSFFGQYKWGCHEFSPKAHLSKCDWLCRDTSGENNYHNTSSFDDDLLLEYDTRGGAAAARLGRTQDDLSKFKARIDNNVEQQKEYSEMMEALQRKVQTE